MKAQPKLPVFSPRWGRIPLAAFWIVAAGLLAGGCSEVAKPAPSRAPKNVIVFCIDTLRGDHVGAYGYSRDTTPRIDRLAAEGALFERPVSQSNWTVPATATLLTSLYPSEHGAMIEGGMRNLSDMPPSQLRRDVETLGDLFHAAGSRTGLFSANPFLHGRFTRGFDIAEVKRQNATSLTDKAIAWIGEQPEKPFFIHLQYMDLHQPIEPPEPYFNYFEVLGAGPRGPEHSGWSFGNGEHLETAEFESYRAHKIALYDGALRYVDAEIGRLVDELADLGLLDQSLLVVTSDHGEEFWDHAEVEKEQAVDPRGLSGVGHGHSMFDELLRVPLIFQGPGVPEVRVDCPVRLLDVAPTILDLFGLPALPEMRGVALASIWAERGRGSCEDPPQIADSPAYGPDSQAVIWKKRKLIVSSAGDLLFDLRSDAGERNDLSEAQPEVMAALKERLAAELAPTGPREPGETMEYDAETERQLRALGYLGG